MATYYRAQYAPQQYSTMTTILAALLFVPLKFPFLRFCGIGILTSQGGYSSDNIQKLHEDVHEVTGLLKKNVDSAIQRGQQLDDIEDRAEQLNQSSREFSDKAVRLKRKLWWQNTKGDITNTVCNKSRIRQ
ncbi:uncharacterized protein TRIADDRAFT_51531 [Trichoplax adhaerens]|uniref:V-SNARE coiled-coil homology domain-containing protein n=1 Tax=Trichoplax adhaerens TaxID=10228 RepID=B3RJN7_TRIAD|nr:hypothetical protein TRIADDRAFT_51531 [Trichoplax adhaerens]EDV28529.1 hypothetical protein TRIADDRAFT_51531 [Trichoplax adhaerens]|eukprot:XP_002107731.1 hypothetical protein TRIADDRAFT_51531 [Trichoplax adhaerens]